jgi:hypothetical protein
MESNEALSQTNQVLYPSILLFWRSMHRQDISTKILAFIPFSSLPHPLLLAAYL